MEHPARLVIAHSSRIFQECLVSVLSDLPELHVSRLNPGDGGFLGAVVGESPDVLLVDAGLPERGAVELVRHARSHLPDVKVVVLARRPDDEDLHQCFAAGVHACVLDDASVAELNTALQTVLRGEAYCSPRLVHEMFRRMTQPAEEPWRMGEGQEAVLTTREQEIVELIGQRLSNKEIARRLFISLHTVKNHVHNIVEKLHADDRFEVFEIAQGRRMQGRGSFPRLLTGNASR